MPGEVGSIPSEMLAAVYDAPGRVAAKRVPVPSIGAGELLVRVEACGICGTDLKKIAHGLQSPPRIYGHEFAGTVVRAGAGAPWRSGQRVAVYHHVPCRSCYLCCRGAYSQCAAYKKTGTTAGFEPAGGGWAQFVRVMDWVARDGVLEVPTHVIFQQASLMEPINTCLKCVRTMKLQPGETVVIFGQGPIGLMLTELCVLEGAKVIGVDVMASRLERSRRFGAFAAVNPRKQSVLDVTGSLPGGGADAALVATPSETAVEDAIKAARPAGRIMLFAQTEREQTMALPVGQVCVLEKQILGSYSSSIDLNEEVAGLLFNDRVRGGELISHTFPLEEIAEAISLAQNPDDKTLKIVIEPNKE